MDDQVDRRRDLVADRPQRQLVAGHQDHRLEPPEHVRRGVGVTGRERAVLTGRHRLEHVEGLARSTLPDDDPVGSHVQPVAQQVADGDLALALEVRRAGLELDDMRLVELQFGGILDGDDPLVLGDERRQDVERRGLPGTGAAGDEDIEACLDAGAQEVEHLGRGRPEPDEVVDGDRLRRELPHGDDRPDQRQGLDDRVDPRAVRQARVHARARCVDPPPERGDDPVDDAQDVLVVQEVAVDAGDLPRTFDVQVARPVDHDLGDRLVEKEGVQRPEATDLADQLFGQALTLVMGHRVPVDVDDPVDDGIDLDPELFRIVDVEQRIEGDHDFGLEAQPDLAQQVLAGGDRGRRWGHDRDRGRRDDDLDRAIVQRAGALLCLLDPLEQRHEIRPPRDERL